MVLLTASMARVLGAGRGGQLVAAVATACCAEYLGAMHELTTTVARLRVLDGGAAAGHQAARQRRPALVGGCRRRCGRSGLAAKWNIGFLLAGLLLGFACTPAARPLLRSRYLALGAVLFAALAAPDVGWQALHGWPNLAVFRALQQRCVGQPGAATGRARSSTRQHRAGAAVGARHRLVAAVGRATGRSGSRRWR